MKKTFVFLILTYLSLSPFGRIYAQCPQNLDQDHGSSNTGTFGANQWQSFTAGITGKLTQVDLFKNGCETYSFTLNIYAGTGNGGALLYSNTYNFNTCSVWINMAIPIGSAPNVVAGSVYTIELVMISSSSGSPLGFTAHTGNAYPNGSYFSNVYGSPANWDLNFKTYVTNPNAPTATIGSTVQVSCFGGNNGSAVSTVAGGTGPYTFSWLPSGATSSTAIGLSAGTHTLTVTDAAGCTATASTVVSQPAAITLSTVPMPVNCFGTSTGSIDLTVSGGLFPYTFNWGGGVTTEDRSALAAGTYSVVVTDGNGCTANTSASITQPASNVTLTTIVTNVSCNGGANGAIDLIATGGTPPYTFDWGGGITSEDRSALSAGTYSVIATDANGCSNNTAASVTQPASLTLNTVNTNVTCNGGSDGNIDLTVTGGTPGYVFDWGGGISSEDRSSLNTGTYFVTVTDANGCTGNTSATITQPAPFVPNAGSDVTICNGDNITLSASGAVSYSWSPATGLSNASIANPVANPVISTSYTLSAVDANGCSGTDVLTITVNTPANANAGSDQTICAGDFVTLSGMIGGSASSSTWTTSGSGTFTSTTSVNSTYIPSGTDISSGTVTLTLTTNIPPAPCPSVVDQLTVTINQPATVNAGTDFILCEGTSVALNGIVTGGTGTGNWSGGTGTFSPGTNVLNANYTPLIASGTEVLTLTSPDPDGAGPCTATSDDLTVTVFALPVVNFTSLSPVCEDNPIFTLTGGSPAGGVYSGNGVSTGTQFTASSAGAGTHVITYTYTDGNGCSASATQNQVVNPLPTPSLSLPSGMCIDNPLLPLNMAVPAGGIYSGIGVNSGNYDPQQAGVGNDTLYYSYTDANGCTAVSFAATTIHPLPTVSFSAQTPVCLNDPSFALTGGLPAGGIYSGNGVSNPNFDPLVAGVGTHTLTYTFTDANACSASSNQSINVNANPVINFPVLNPVCVNSTPLTLSSASPTGGNYSGTGVSGSVFDPSVAGTGTFTITYSYTDLNGCNATQNQNIVVSPVPNATLDPLVPVCLNAGVIPLFGGLPAGGVFNGTGVSGSDFDPLQSGIGNFAINYVYTDPGGCSDTATQFITVNPIPIVNAGSDQLYCEGSAVLLNGSGAAVYNWSPASGLSSTNVSSPLAQPGSTTVYTLTGTDTNGCSANDQVEVTVVSANAVSAGSDQLICSGSSTQLFGSGGINYQWYGTAISDSTLQNPVVTPANPDYYSVLIETAEGCFFYDTVFVDINTSGDCSISEFNSFSPEGDGINDVWIITNISAFPENKVTILNRWGNTLVEIENYNNLDRVWNGEFNGEILPSGTYFFVIQTFNPNRSQSGWLYLTR